MLRRATIPLLLALAACGPSVKVGKDYTLELRPVLADGLGGVDGLALDLTVATDDATVHHDLGTSKGQSWSMPDLGALDAARLGLLWTTPGTDMDPIDPSGIAAWGQSAPVTIDADTLRVPVVVGVPGTVGGVDALPGDLASMGGAVARLSNGDVLVFGGTAHGVLDGSVELTNAASKDILRLSLADDALAFEKVGEMPSVGTNGFPERAAATATVVTVDGKEQVLVVGGRKAWLNPASGNANAAFLWDPESESVTWSDVLGVNTARSGHLAARMPDGSVIVLGGFRPNESNLIDYLQLTWQRWSPDGPTISQEAPALSGIGPVGMAMATLGDDGVLVCGGGTKANATIPSFTPSMVCGIISPTGVGHLATPIAAGIDELPGAARMWHAMATLADGRVLLTGGISANTGGVGAEATAPAVGDAFLYDPGSDIWSRVGNLVHPRAMHAMLALPDGSALVIGGAVAGTGMPPGQAPDPVECTERFDPQTSTFAEVGACGAAGSGMLPMLATAPDDTAYGAFVLGGIRADGGGTAWGVATLGPSF